MTYVNTDLIFEHDFASGLGPFRSHGNIETMVTGTQLRMEHCPGLDKKKKHRKIGDGLFAKVCLVSGTKYKLSLEGRLSGNKTKFKINVYNKTWERVEILDENPLQVSSETDEGYLVFMTMKPSEEQENVKEKYYIVVSFCRCSNCHYQDYYSDTHFHKRAYLSDLKINKIMEEESDDETTEEPEIVEEPEESIEEEPIDWSTVNNLHIKEGNNTQLGSLVKFTMPDGSIQMKHDPDIQTAFIEHYIAVNVCLENNDGTISSEICHMPLYKLDEQL